MHKQNMRGFPKNGATSNVPTREYKTSGTNVEWTIPAGVTAWSEIIIGGGAGANGGVTVAGTASSTTYDSLTVTAPGGTNSGAASNGGATPTNGDLNLPGQAGWIPVPGEVKGGDTPLGFGFGSIGTGPGGGFGAGGALVATDSAGGSGSVAIKRRVRVAGQNSVTYTVGVGGNAMQDGAGGMIIFEY